MADVGGLCALAAPYGLKNGLPTYLPTYRWLMDACHPQSRGLRYTGVEKLMRPRSSEDCEASTTC